MREKERERYSEWRNYAMVGTADTTVDATTVRGRHGTERISQAIVVGGADNGDGAIRTSPAGIADA